MNILKTWAKFPQLRGKKLLLASSCLQDIFPKAYETFVTAAGTQSDGSNDPTSFVVMTVCPEADLGSVLYGKLASMCRSTSPTEIRVLTIEGSPHCYTLHASVNEAIYILGEKIPTRHFVCINDDDIREIQPDAIRLSRYIHLVNKLIADHPEIMTELEQFSLEYKAALDKMSTDLKEC